MTAPHIIDPAGLLGEALSQASPDLMRSLLQHVINALLSADADTVCGAQWGQQDPAASRQAQWVSTPAPGHQGRHHRRGDPQTAFRYLLPVSGCCNGANAVKRALITVVAHCSWREHPRAVWTSSSKPWESQDCPSPRSHVWQQTSTNTSNSSATVPSMTLVLSRSSPLTH